MEKNQLREGLKVHYVSPHDSTENGMIKSWNESETTVWVVYNCNNEWPRYFDYTGAATNIEDLRIGWV